MAPIKPPVQAERIRAAHTTLTKGRTAALGRWDDLSLIKSLFTRTYKKDNGTGSRYGASSAFLPTEQ